MACNCNKGKKVLNNIVTIGNAIIDYSFNNEDANNKAKQRLQYCVNCPNAQPFILYKAIPDNLFPQIQGKKCSLCGCSLSLKIRSNDFCPIKKW